MASNLLALQTGDLATRIRANDWSAMGDLFPNPDPLLKELGWDIDVYRKISRDPHVGACIRRRKSAVKALEWGLDRGKAPSRTAKVIERMLSRLDLDRIVGQMLEATLYGYQPMEVIWERTADGVIPVDVMAKPPEWFCFDADNALRFKTRQAPVYGELVPDRKFLIPRQDPTYQNPYGLADLSLCYWPVIFKKGGIRFWLTFAEKFGSAFAVGKLPRGASNDERAALLDSLDALIQDGVATIPDDDSVQLIEMAGKAASADLYERLVMFCRSEISIVLTGTNQTVEASSNKASATAGMEVAADLRDGDAGIVESAINQLIRWTCEVNWPSSEPPVWSMWDQESQDLLKAQRDKSNFEAGAKFTNAYWMRSYGYQDGDLVPEGVPIQGVLTSTSASFAEGTATADPMAADVAQLDTVARPSWDALIDALRKEVDAAKSLIDLQDRLIEIYANQDAAEMVQIMQAAYALAQLKGMVDAAAAKG